jgi:Tfp pilus assembly protein PilZ
MATRKSMTRLLPLLRELGTLERKRIKEGVTPEEYQRWRDLNETLKQHVDRSATDGSERRKHLRVPTRLLIEVESQDKLREAVIRNISLGGLFIDTPIVLAIGESFTLCIRVGATGERVDVPCEVVSSNVGPDFDVPSTGIGVKFGTLGPEQREAIDELFATALCDEEAEELCSD